MDEILEKRHTTWLWVVLIVGTVTSICFWLFPITIVLIVMLCKRIEFNNKISDEIKTAKRKQKKNLTLNKDNITTEESIKLAIDKEKENFRVTTYTFVKWYLSKKQNFNIKNNLTIWQYLELIVKHEKKNLWFFTYDDDIQWFNYFGYNIDQKEMYTIDYKKAISHKQNVIILEYSNSNETNFNKMINNLIDYKIKNGSLINFKIQ